jgi:uncharacterized membrane protein (DUF2068 family)
VGEVADRLLMADASTLSAPTGAKGAGLLRAIGIFKLTKGTLLIAAAISVFHLLHKNLADLIYRWARLLRIAPGNIYVERLVERVLKITNQQLVVIGIVLLVYAGMFIVEGIGLLRLKRWAEWMTVITTSGLIPIELYEVIRRPGWIKVIAMIVNVAIAVYLAMHVAREMKEKRHADQPHSNETGVSTSG